MTPEERKEKLEKFFKSLDALTEVPKEEFEQYITAHEFTLQKDGMNRFYWNEAGELKASMVHTFIRDTYNISKE